MTRPWILVFCFLCILTVLRGQDTSMAQKKDLVDVLVQWLHIHLPDSSRSKRSVIFSVIPLAPANTGQKKAAISMINMAFYADDPKTTNLSSIYFLPYTNFSGTNSFTVTPNIWISANRWNFNGDLRIMHTDILTYGPGGNTPSSNENEIEYRYVRVYLNANRQIWGPLSAGMGYNLDYYYTVTDKMTAGTPNVFSEYGTGTGEETKTTGVSFNLTYNKRSNLINPSAGFYSSLSFRINPPIPGSPLRWSSIYSDTRKYISLSTTRHSVLGFWALYWGTFGEVPYLNLPGTSLDPNGRTGRGYAYGRYLGKQLLYGESEWRFDISTNGLLGAVVFANVQAYSEPGSGEFSYPLPAAGTGLRIKFNKRNDMNITLDFAAGKNSFQWYVNLGEFF